ncbi:glycosyltransferase family 2 protein [Dyadobacter sp. CY343]|uniref:glycosyltransferase n=1 Tax=Dyadobacter sp. CY343 TaxID=2907299 RepID=UPI001F434920|nr:glycosyltransferase family A protein [Dyadobacter sp. CY343]MCE7059707.1 glycosyltransferase [Dyadobacter sp. CY343]
MQQLREPKVSIIIPIYQDWHRLAFCISALQQQTYGKEHFEVIVVNNDRESSSPADLVLPFNFKLVHESKAGSYSARNKGLIYASGDIIGFTDSDCIPDKNWISNAVDLFIQNPNVGRIAGRIDLFYKGISLTPAELYEKVYAFKQDHVVEKLASSVTGNMFTRREVIDTVGGFNENLFSGGDHEWSRRAEQAGFKIVFGSNVIIKHPARSDLSQLIRKSKRIEGGRTAVNKFGKFNSFIRLAKAVKPPFMDLFYYLGRYGKDLSLKEKVIVCLVKYYLVYIERLEEFKLSFGRIASRE